jgi:hypothetical protein
MAIWSLFKSNNYLIVQFCIKFEFVEKNSLFVFLNCML